MCHPKKQILNRIFSWVVASLVLTAFTLPTPPGSVVPITPPPPQTLNPRDFDVLVTKDRDLAMVVKKGGASGKVEVHFFKIVHNGVLFQNKIVTSLSAIDVVEDYDFIALHDVNQDGKEDLVYVQRKDASGKVGLHALSSSDQFQTSVLSSLTPIPGPGDVDNFTFTFGHFKWGRIDSDVVVAVKKTNTGSTEPCGNSQGCTEVHLIDIRNPTRFITNLPTRLNRTDATWDFLFFDQNGDSFMDLVGIKKQGGAGATEVHSINGRAKGKSTKKPKEWPFRFFALQQVSAMPFMTAFHKFSSGDFDQDGQIDIGVFELSPQHCGRDRHQNQIFLRQTSSQLLSAFPGPFFLSPTVSWF